MTIWYVREARQPILFFLFAVVVRKAPARPARARALLLIRYYTCLRKKDPTLLPARLMTCMQVMVGLSDDLFDNIAGR